MNSNELLELVDKNIIIEILEELGSPCSGMGCTSDGSEYLTFRTVCHNGDSVDKLWWYENTKKFQCWTCCGSMSLFDLISKVLGYSFRESFVYVANKVGVTLDNHRHGIQEEQSVRRIKEEIANNERILESRNTKSIVQSINKFYNKDILKYFDNNTFYCGWENEGISENSMRKYNISFYWLEGHIIIPHYNENGDLVGIRRRSLNPEDANNKYMPEYINGKMYDHPLGLNLYGLYENKASITRKKSAIIVEGEKSVLLSDSYYGDESIAVATCGFNVSDWQMRKLRSFGVRSVYLGFDKDYDVTKENEYKKDKIVWNNYNHYKTRLITLANRMSMYFTTYIIFDRKNLLDIKDSPMDKGKETFEKLIKDAKLIKME